MSKEETPLLTDRLQTVRPRRPYPWLALTFISVGVVLFLFSFWPNIAKNDAVTGDMCELIGTAGLVFGALMFVRRISRSTYATRLFLTGSFLLVFARILDFTEEVPAYGGLAIIGLDGFAHVFVMRLSESVGYICLLLTMLALMYELSQIIDFVQSESLRYRDLHQASQYLARVADLTADAVFAVNGDCVIQVWNRGAEKLFGYSKDDAAHLNLKDVVTSGLDCLGADILECVSTRGSLREIDVVARRKDGSVFDAGASFSAVTGDDGEAVGVSIVVRDIQDRKRAERELYESRKLLSNALHAADVGLFVLDRETRAIEFNARMQELTGMSMQEITDGSLEAIAERLVDDPRGLINAITDRVLRRGKHVELRNLRLRRPDGTVRTCNGAIAPVMDEHGNIIAAAGVAVDTTEREALQTRLLEAQKMDSVGRLAGGIAHDFNNILTGVLGYATLAKQSVPSDSPVMKHLAQIEASAVRASELTHQLLTFARGSARIESKVSVHPILDAAIKLVSHSLNPNIHVTFSPVDSVDQISADPGQVHQMLMNLCLNARDAINSSGEIHLAAGNVEVSENERERTQVAVPGRYVRIRVEDTGKGMTPEVSRRIFEPFFSTKKQGQAYGLGLSVVYGIVHSQRGAITVDSVVGRGTCIDVYLPSAGQSVMPMGRDNGAVAQKSDATVLVVDDEQLLRAVLHDILEMSGFRVLQASTGEEAIEIYKERQDEISVIILDVVMPGMGGAKALDELIKIDPQLRCVISSGFGGEAIGDKHQSRNLRFVPKPFSTASVVSAVQDLLQN